MRTLHAAGMNDHVAKPIEPEDLWNALLKWIKPRHAVAPASSRAKAALRKFVAGQDQYSPNG